MRYTLCMNDEHKVLKKRTLLNKFSFESHLFIASKNGDNKSIQELFRVYPVFKNYYINKQNHLGETPVFAAAINEKWDTVKLLLDNNAIPTIKNNKKESLLSLAIYHSTSSLALTKKILPYYTNQDLNNECKTLTSNTHIFRATEDCHTPAKEFIDDVINGNKTLESIDHNHHTALHMACYLPDIPSIIELLKRSANLMVRNNEMQTPYDCLKKYDAALFAVRETLNRGRHPHLTCVMHLMFSEDSLHMDIIRIIIKNIIDLWLPSPALCNAERLLWLPVCEQACALKKIDRTNTNECLDYIMALSHEERTELNKQLLFNSI